MNIFTKIEKKKIIKKTPSQSKKIDRILKIGAALAVVFLAGEIALYSGIFIKNKTESWTLKADLLSLQEQRDQLIESTSTDLPKQKVADELYNQSHSWAKALSQIETIANIEFAQADGQDNLLKLTGTTVSQQHYSLTSLAKLIRKFEDLPFIKKVTVNNSDKKALSAETFESSFELEVEIDWTTFHEQIATQTLPDNNINPDLEAIADLVAIGEISKDGQNLITLKWTDTDQAALYYVFGGKDEADFHWLGSTNTSQFKFKIEDPRQVYTFQVFPVDNSGRCGINSEVVFARSGDEVPPEKVSNLKQNQALSISDNGQNLVTIALEWDPISDQDLSKYLIFSGNRSDQLKLVAETNDAYFTLTQPLMKTGIIWAVVAEDMSGNRSQPALVIK